MCPKYLTPIQPPFKENYPPTCFFLIPGAIGPNHGLFVKPDLLPEFKMIGLGARDKHVSWSWGNTLNMFGLISAQCGLYTTWKQSSSDKFCIFTV